MEASTKFMEVSTASMEAPTKLKEASSASMEDLIGVLHGSSSGSFRGRLQAQ